VLGDVHARGVGHVLVDEVVDAPGEACDGEAGALGEWAHGRLGCGEIDGHAAADEIGGVEVAEHQVGIGDRRLCAAPAVGGGARLGARADGPDLQEADVVEISDGAAAGADLDQLQGRDAHGQAAALDEAALARDLEAVGDRGLAVVDDAELGRGAAHVEGQHMRAAVARAEMGGDQRAGGRPGFQQLHRRALGLLDVGEAAVESSNGGAACRGRDPSLSEPDSASGLM
jgi:hypothetical protein